MKKVDILLTSLVLLGCDTGGEWKAEELRNWYFELSKADSRFLSPLYYQGTDEDSHHFTCRSMDTWVPVRVRKEEINIQDVRPLKSASQTRSFPGYYAVDPEKAFAKLNREEEGDNHSLEAIRAGALMPQ